MRLPKNEKNLDWIRGRPWKKHNYKTQRQFRLLRKEWGNYGDGGARNRFKLINGAGKSHSAEKCTSTVRYIS